MVGSGLGHQFATESSEIDMGMSLSTNMRPGRMHALKYHLENHMAIPSGKSSGKSKIPSGLFHIAMENHHFR